MLELSNITKVYKTEGFTQKALDGVSIKFRRCEFAAILGPSGSGKTTLLNIIGGLDKYTSGNLIINDISTKKFNDRDWDTYRNHRVGFVFQSYNLIGHQTVLKNVELALTLSGISKSERKKRATEALEKVGLGEHINKKPSQLSGGQMQRVAIARALINDPDIILADEPTGALDSDTSLQVMDILKKIAKDKLVVMVTHNPDLAEEYATRIIKLKDGKITDDSNAFDGKEKAKEDDASNSRKTKMSYFTALSLSFNNLMTKKGRTLLVAFAGSIGIIGIALIMALSSGFQSYIDHIQEDTLSSYPLTIQQESMDMTSLLLTMSERNGESDGTNIVKEQQTVINMLSSVKSNDIKSLKKYLENNKDKYKDDVDAISYTYSVDPLLYTYDATNTLIQINPNSLFVQMYGGNRIASSFSSMASIFSQMPDDEKMYKEDYKILAGRYPKKYDEVMIALPSANSIPDLLVYSLGLKDMSELTNAIKKIMNGEAADKTSEPLSITYEDLMKVKMKMVLPTELYKYNKEYKVYENMSSDKKYIKELYDKGMELKVVGIITRGDDSNSSLLTTGVYYRSDLIKHIIEESSKTDIVKKQIDNDEVDVFSGKRFDDKNDKLDLDFKDFVEVDKKAIKEAFDIKIDENTITNLSKGYMEEINKVLTVDVSPAYKELTSNLVKFENGIKDTIGTNPISMNDVDTIVDDYLNNKDNKAIFSSLEKKYLLPSSTYTKTYSGLLKGLINVYIMSYYAMDQSLTEDPSNMTGIIIDDMWNPLVENYNTNADVSGALQTVASYMSEALLKKNVMTKIGELTTKLAETFAKAFNVDPSKIASAFKIKLDEDQIMRLMTSMTSSTEANTATANLITLGYQDLDEPTYLSVYFTSFDGKEHFLNILKSYNDKMKEDGHEEKVINFTDASGILMGSVKTIVNAVSYVLIAFVSVSLVVSSIMIGIITYISVYERTKEIGILRAIGASKHNITTIFNAETFIIGFLSGLIGIGITYLSLPFINRLIHHFTGNIPLNAYLAYTSAISLVLLSIILTLIGGFIPSKHASRKDPVEALRTE